MQLSRKLGNSRVLTNLYLTYLKNLCVNPSKRSLAYSKRSENRFWWHRLPGASYVPPLYSSLTKWEWSIIESWYKDTNNKKLIGESTVPIMSVMQGFIMGNCISNVVQLGHYSGYSTLLIGFMLRKMGKKNSFFTVDIDPFVSKYTQKWVDRAGLNDYINIQIGDSSEKIIVDHAKRYFNGPINMVFIDSSHQYAHTLRELSLWYENLEKGGIIFMHDTSVLATQYDSTHCGGVKKAIEEWKMQNASVELINICGELPLGKEQAGLIYKDGCGLGIIQKKLYA